MVHVVYGSDALICSNCGNGSKEMIVVNGNESSEYVPKPPHGSGDLPLVQYAEQRVKW